MGRVLIRKSDGFPIEYQSGDAALGALIQNAINAGYQSDEVEEKYISNEEYSLLKKEKIDDPEKLKKKNKLDIAKNKIKNKLNLSDSDLDDLRLIIFN